MPEDIKAFYAELSAFGHPLWARAKETHPTNWGELDVSGNDKRLADHSYGPGSLVGAIMAPGAFSVFDIDRHGDDPAAWGDVDAVVTSLEAAGVIIAARVATPGGGHHLYVPASPEYVCDIRSGGLRDFPGVEFQGKSNVYLPGSRRGKHDYRGYELEFSDLGATVDDELAMDASVDALESWLKEHVRTSATVERAPDVSPPMPEHPSEVGQVHNQVIKAVTDEVAKVEHAKEGNRDILVTGTIFKLGRYAYLEAVNDGEIISRENVRELMRQACERNGLIGSKPGDLSPAAFDRKFDRQWSAGAAKAQRAVPFDPVGSEFTAVTGGSRLGGIRTEDRDVAESIMPGLKDRLVYTPAMGWLLYDPKRGAWRRATDARVLGLVMEAMAAWLQTVIPRANPGDFSKLAKLRDDVKGRHVMSQVATFVQRDDAEFDAHPDLLCVGNGVVDLTTGQLRDHDPALLLTKSSRTPYLPGAVHADWDKALASLPQDDRDWFQGRIGQGITGHTPTDDRVVFLKNSGSGAKSTLLTALQTALGEHMTKVPEKVLTSPAEGHSTELTELRGARLAYIEELPKGRTLNVKRLKDIAGTDVMDGRRMYKDVVRWRASHSLILTTNYDLHVAETDHGTWRRLALLEFPYTYVEHAEQINDPARQRVKDTSLRTNLSEGKGGRAEAVLAWAVEGAQNWYAADRNMAPLTESVKASTEEWRGREDVIKGFLEEFLEFDPRAMVSMKELYDVFSDWRTSNGKMPMSSASFRSAFEDHELVSVRGVSRGRVKNPSSITWFPDDELALERDSAKSPYVMRGVTWRTN